MILNNFPARSNQAVYMYEKNKVHSTTLDFRSQAVSESRQWTVSSSTWANTTPQNSVRDGDISEDFHFCVDGFLPNDVKYIGLKV